MTTSSNEKKTTGPDSASRRLAIWAILGFGAIVFIAGAVYSGSLFLSNTSAIAELAQNSADSAGEKLAGADTSSVQGNGTGDSAGVPTKQASDPRFAFLLMGFGGAGHDGAYLTDSMMVVIVDPSQKTLTMLSLPRDAWVPILFDGQKPVYNKLNTAYAFGKDSSLYTNRLARYKGNQGAGLLSSDTISRLLGIPISYYVALDFAGFRQMIDVVGGIDVDIPDSFSAEYPANDDPSIDDSWKVVRFRQGVEHMNGERAIEYARARETLDNVSEGSDFARSRRQRLIMEAFKARLFQPDGLVHLPQLLAVAASHMDTNYSLPSVAQFTQLAMDWKSVRFYQAALTNTNYLAEATGPEGTYILVPDSADHSWAPIRALDHQLWQNPEVGSAMANTEIVVQNNTGVAGVAGKVTEALSQMGYRVGTPITGTTSAHSQVLDRTGGENKALIGQLQADLKVDLGQVVPEKGPSGIILAIGSDDAVLADLSVPVDASAPTSAVGIVRANPAPAAPVAAEEPPATAHTPTPVPAPRRTPVPAATVLPGGTRPSGGIAQPTPSPSASVPRWSTPTPRATPTTNRVAHPTATPTPLRSTGTSPTR